MKHWISSTHKLPCEGGGGGQLAEAVLSILIFPLIPQETPSPPKKELIRTLRLLPELQSYEEAILVRSLRA